MNDQIDLDARRKQIAMELATYVPDEDELQEAYEYWASGCGGSDGGEVARFVAAHEQKVAERLESAIKAGVALLSQLATLKSDLCRSQGITIDLGPVTIFSGDDQPGKES